MRSWIQVVIGNETLYNDFTADMQEREALLNLQVQKSINESKFDEARKIVAEINVYQSMRKRFKTERQEIVSCQNHQTKE